MKQEILQKKNSLSLMETSSLESKSAETYLENPNRNILHCFQETTVNQTGKFYYVLIVCPSDLNNENNAVYFSTCSLFPNACLNAYIEAKIK